MQLLRYLLFPFSLIYALAVGLRNLLFDKGIIMSRKGALRTIVIGNLTAGGTGKTPFTQFLIELFEKHHLNPAVLSRGFGRNTKGFRLVSTQDSAQAVGDEPYQMKQRFQTTSMAVCEDRIQGLKQLKELSANLQFAILDDAFQHRHLNPDLSILLTDYNRPYYKDWYLPTGDLRDSVSQKSRADLIIVTKCPALLSGEERENISSRIQPSKEQQIFFFTTEYGRPTPVFQGGPLWKGAKKAFGFSGIAHPEPFKHFLSEGYSLKKFKSYPDHHVFSEAELLMLRSEYDTFADPDLVLLTTEKDAGRVRLSETLRELPLFYIPISIRPLERQEILEEILLSKARGFCNE